MLAIALCACLLSLRSNYANAKLHRVPLTLNRDSSVNSSLAVSWDAWERSQEDAWVARRTPDGQRRVLFVDVRGPTRMTGDGVRVMSMIMDLRTEQCDFAVEVLSNVEDYGELKRSWSNHIAQKYLSNIHFWRSGQFTDTNRSLELAKFDKIFVGAKLDLLDGGDGVAKTVVTELQKFPEQYRPRVSIIFDDVPETRCKFNPEVCPRVPAVVSMLTSVAHEFIVLGEDDKMEMMTQIGILREKEQEEGKNLTREVEFRTWPMRIDNMVELFPSKQFEFPAEGSTSKTFITMMGNHHAVNNRMVDTLFNSLAISQICDAINGSSNKDMKLMFLGRLSDEAAKLNGTLWKNQNLGCVVIREGFIDEAEFKRDIFPKTRAILNPFFFDVQSGISVKNYEAVMLRMPFVTHSYGMRGLNDIEDCKSFPMPTNATNTTELVEFVVDHIVNEAGYAEFVKQFNDNADRCQLGQSLAYPPEEVCPT